MLGTIVRGQTIKASAVVGFFPCSAFGDDIFIFDPKSKLHCAT